MHARARLLALAAAAAPLLLPLAPAAAQQAATAAVPSPRQVLGFEVGADRKLADWSQITGYFARLAAASPAVRVDTLGPTTSGRPLIVATISTPENVRRLDAIRRAQARLADPRQLTAADEAALRDSQPAVVLIQGNIHGSEIAASQMAMELAYRLATNDTLQRALRDAVVLLLPSANPDGTQIVTEWYRRTLGTPWEGGPVPWLYHPYVGHDNNRDWYMVTQKETKLVTDLLYRQWFPEIVYDVHQMGSEGARLFVPPFVDPLDPNVDALIVRGIGHVGAEMAWALQGQGKQGVADQVIYDLWWHGGARSTPTRHNMIGILTEAASVKVATPIVQTPKDLKGHDRGLPRYQRQMNFPDPWPGGTWHLRDIVDYELIAAEQLVKLAAQERGDWVRDFVSLGRKQVRLGESESPRAFVIPQRQPDHYAAEKLVDVLRAGGVEVESRPGSTIADGRNVGPAWLVSLAQPYRAHAKDLLEVQHFPRMEKYPGGPVERPYDVAGWTLPLQMGVTVLSADSVRSGPASRMACAPAPAALLDARDTRSYFVAFDSLRRGGAVRRATRPLAGPCGERWPAGAFVTGRGTPRDASGAAVATGARLRTPRVALYKPWTANMDEGWTRWLFDQVGVPYRNVTDSVIKAGGLRDQFDVLIVPDMSLREARDGMSPSQVPPEYAGGLGSTGLASLAQFVQAGGTLVTLDRAAEVATTALTLPVKRVTVPPRQDDWEDEERTPDATRRAGPPLYAPGSILRVLVDTRHPVAYGMRDTAAVYFTNSVSFDVTADARARVIARYPEREGDILLSGFLQGGAAIAGKAAAVDVPVGEGRVIMFGFRPQYRGQSYGTFRMLFNAILEGGSAQGARR